MKESVLKRIFMSWQTGDGKQIVRQKEGNHTEDFCTVSLLRYLLKILFLIDKPGCCHTESSKINKQYQNTEVIDGSSGSDSPD